MTTTTAADTSAVPQPRPAAGTGAPTAAVRAIGLRKTYGHGDNAVHALDGVDVDFHAGRFTAVMGPSGSGKSTLMHVTAGLDTATSGQVLLGDTDLTTLKDKALTALRRDRIGFVFQQFNLLPTLTALENITLPLALAGRRADREWLDRIVEVVGLRVAPRAPAGRAVRRPAAAGRRGPRAGQPAGGRVRRRADRQPRLPVRGRGAVVPAALRRGHGPDDRDGHP